MSPDERFFKIFRQKVIDKHLCVDIMYICFFFYNINIFLMKCIGITAIAKFSQESLVENEVLPQCWEQLAHKYLERRLLVAESCVALIPYVSVS